MTMEIQATFRHLEPTEALERQIFDSARALDQLTGGEITHCHVILEGRPRGARPGATHARIAILGSRGALGVTHDIRFRATKDSPPEALIEAFDGIRVLLRSEQARRKAATRAPDEGRSQQPGPRKAVLSWA